MAEEQKPTTNVDAEQDVQNVLAELKGDSGAEEKVAQEDAEEARIVAEATKLGQKSEQAEEKSGQQRESRGYQRGGRFRNNAKFDPSSQKETDDPVEIRKQVCAQDEMGLMQDKLANALELGRVLLLRFQPPHGQVSAVAGGRQRQQGRASERCALLQAHAPLPAFQRGCRGPQDFRDS